MFHFLMNKNHVRGLEHPNLSLQDSWDAAIIPLGSENRLREKYVTFMGGVRVGRLLEDLDVFAGEGTRFYWMLHELTILDLITHGLFQY